MKQAIATNAAIAPSELDEIRVLIEQRAAILLDASRERFFSARVQDYANEKNLSSGAAVLQQIRSSGLEYEALLERLLTQETSFFRYASVFEALTKEIVPSVHKRKLWQNPRTLRIWSAGCSTGEEPYSIAIALCENLKLADAWEIEVLATDVSRQALRHAEHGLYSKRKLQNITPSQIEEHFTKTKHGFQVKPRIQRMISFAQMNLAESAYVGKFDCIFCMNVLMYFSPARRLTILQQFYESLEPGGYFLLGHSETLSNVATKFDSMIYGDCRVYRKPLSLHTESALTVAGENL